MSSKKNVNVMSVLPNGVKGISGGVGDVGIQIPKEGCKDMIHVRYYTGDGVAKIGELVDVVTIGDCDRVVVRQESDPRYICLFPHDILGIYDGYDRDNSVENIKKHMNRGD